jgi:hypothetical protein
MSLLSCCRLYICTWWTPGLASPLRCITLTYLSTCSAHSYIDSVVYYSCQSEILFVDLFRARLESILCLYRILRVLPFAGGALLCVLARKPHSASARRTGVLFLRASRGGSLRVFTDGVGVAGARDSCSVFWKL